MIIVDVDLFWWEIREQMVIVETVSDVYGVFDIVGHFFVVFSDLATTHKNRHVWF